MGLSLFMVLCCAGVMGCSLLPGSSAGAQAPAAAPQAKSAASAPASTASVPTNVVPERKAEPEAPISPTVQRAFDDARRAMRAGRMDEAERGFKAVVQAQPELGGPHANLGVIYRQANKLPEAVTELERAVKASPQQPVYFNQLGITYRQQGQFTKAREAYERAIDLDASYAAATLNLGILNDLYLWDGKRALELYDRYLALTPGGDATVTKWVADLKNRKAAPAAAAAAASAPRKEKE
jgi:tetratricopeptide (TPR) repeat protein